MENYNVITLQVNNLTYDSIIDYIKSSKKRLVISSVNPEIVLQCEKDSVLTRVINNSDLKIADGIGIVFTLKLLYKKNVERITGIDLFEKILKSDLKSKRIFLYGSAPGVAMMAQDKLNEKYGCNIVKAIDGYEQDNEKIINEINNSLADLVFVGLGCPKQEKWIEENKDKLPNVSLLMGVGGSFDVLSGNIKRAPLFIQKIHLEWLYRLLKQPKRIIRQLSLITFVIKVLKNKEKI